MGVEEGEAGPVDFKFYLHDIITVYCAFLIFVFCLNNSSHFSPGNFIHANF